MSSSPFAPCWHCSSTKHTTSNHEKSMRAVGTELQRMRDKESAEYGPRMVHSIAVSCASFIAALSTSAEVAAYLERRLAPLARGAYENKRLHEALELIASDGRALKEAATPPKKRADEREKRRRR